MSKSLGTTRAALQPPMALLTGFLVAGAVILSPVANRTLAPHFGSDDAAWSSAVEFAPHPSVAPAIDLPKVAQPELVIDRPAKALFATPAAKLDDLFKRLGYDLETVHERGVVPRVFLASLPDFAQIADGDARKRVFIRTVLPLVLHVNELILADRERLVALKARFERLGALAEADAAWLREIAVRYGLGDTAGFDEILPRVDVIPPSLAVAQAAIESGWGTSRFAYEGNALFGQWTYKEGPGIVPRDREDGKTHRIRAYESLMDGVKAYAVNLNSNGAYAEFRKLRAQLRGRERDLGGYDLATTLHRYSERRGEYVRQVRTIIDTNNLGRFDDVRLSSRLAIRVAGLDSDV